MSRADMNGDPRIPILFGMVPATHDAMLVEEGAAVPDGIHAIRFAAAGLGHGAGCACCASRSPVAAALGRAFRERALGTAPFFARVLAALDDEAQIRRAVAADALTQARYRLAEE